MYPHLIQFQTRQMQLEAALRLYGEREAAAHDVLAAARSHEPRPGVIAHLWRLVTGRSSTDPKRAALRRIPLFATLPRQRFALLVRTADIVDMPAGTEVIREGDRGREFFAIADGQVEISMRGRTVAIENAGDVFGEIALLHGIPRTATVTTTEPSRLFVLTIQAFRSVLATSLAGALARAA
jgi:Cyclic nucleotide-binding domain